MKDHVVPGMKTVYTVTLRSSVKHTKERASSVEEEVAETVKVCFGCRGYFGIRSNNGYAVSRLFLKPPNRELPKDTFVYESHPN